MAENTNVWCPVYRIDLFIFGDSGVGKTSITRNFLMKKFRACHISTLIDEVYVVMLKTSMGDVELWIHDTVGQYAVDIRKPEFDIMTAAMIVYNAASIVTSKNVPNWVHDIKRRKLEDGSHVPIMIVGTHADEITRQKADKWLNMFVTRYPACGVGMVSNLLDDQQDMQDGIFAFIVGQCVGANIEIFNVLSPVRHIFLDKITLETYEPEFSVSQKNKEEVAAHQAQCNIILNNLRHRNGLSVEEPIPIPLLKTLTDQEKEIFFVDVELVEA